MIRQLADTNIFIAVLKGDPLLKARLEATRPAINTIVYLELIQGAKNNGEVQKIEEYLTGFELIHFNEVISRRSIRLVREYSKSHGLLLPDAVIAATCLENDLSLITLNTRDFRFIEDLVLSEPLS